MEAQPEREPEESERDMMLAVVVRNGRALKHASDELKGDLSFVLVAVAQSGAALSYVSDDLRQDPVLKSLAALDDDNRVLPHELLRLKLFAHLNYVPDMLEKGVTVATLPTLGDAELKDIMMATMGARKIFMAAVKLPEDVPPEREPEPEPQPEPEVERTFATVHRIHALLGRFLITSAH